MNVADGTSNLTPWKPGQSGNPTGGSKKQRLASRLRELMAMEHPDGGTYADRFIGRVVDIALKTGDVDLIKEIWDRHDGKVAAPAKSVVRSSSSPGDQREEIDWVIGTPPPDPNPVADGPPEDVPGEQGEV